MHFSLNFKLVDSFFKKNIVSFNKNEMKILIVGQPKGLGRPFHFLYGQNKLWPKKSCAFWDSFLRPDLAQNTGEGA